jgi:membrane protease YdiL (CAAX protease family)
MSIRHVLFAITAVALIGGWEALSRDASTADGASRLFVVARATLSFEIFLGALAVAVALFSANGVTHRLGLTRGRLSTAQTLVLVVGTLGISAALDALLDLSQLREYSSLAEFEHLVSGIRGRELLVASVAFVFAPGIAEELLCRGLLQRGLVRRLGAPLGILLASLVFGVLHIDPIHAVFASALGLYLGAICQLANGIRAAIACHIANNGVALLSAALFPEPWMEASWTVFVLGGAVALGALHWVRIRVESVDTDSGPGRVLSDSSLPDRGGNPPSD